MSQGVAQACVRSGQALYERERSLRNCSQVASFRNVFATFWDLAVPGHPFFLQ